MKIPRFYQALDLQTGKQLELSAVNHRHAIQVLRLQAGDPLILFNGEGGEYLARITNIQKRKSHVVLESFDSVDRESGLHSCVVVAMIKPEKMDFAIQKMVELGVSKIQPVYTKRSVIKIKTNRLEKKMSHWRGIIIAACEQSGRTLLPEIAEPLKLPDYLQNQSSDTHANSFVMLPGDHASFTQIEKPLSSISLLIGPEGGFTPEEEKQIQDRGVTAISFGKRILRAETAAISCLTACQLLWGDLTKK